MKNLYRDVNINVHRLNLSRPGCLLVGFQVTNHLQSDTSRADVD